MCMHVYVYIHCAYVYIYSYKITNIQINGIRLMNNRSHKQLSIMSIGPMSYFSESKKKKIVVIICLFILQWRVYPFHNFVSDSLTNQVQRQTYQYMLESPKIMDPGIAHMTSAGVIFVLYVRYRGWWLLLCSNSC